MAEKCEKCGCLYLPTESAEHVLACGARTVIEYGSDESKEDLTEDSQIAVYVAAANDAIREGELKAAEKSITAAGSLVLLRKARVRAILEPQPA